MVDHPDRVAMLSDLEGLDARLDGRLKATLAEVRALIAEERRHFDAHLEGRLKDTFADVRILIAEEGVTTRRHVEMMVEPMSDLMKPLADGVAHHSTVLDDHESRLQQLEK
jgi:hypothetical protein